MYFQKKNIIKNNHYCTLKHLKYMNLISLVAKVVVLWRGFWKIGFTWIYTVLPSVTISIFVIIGVSTALARNRGQ